VGGRGLAVPGKRTGGATLVGAGAGVGRGRDVRLLGGGGRGGAGVREPDQQPRPLRPRRLFYF
jgi:hypothetical protein